MKPIVIIGCGYVGTALGQRLVGNGLNVVGVTRTNKRADSLHAAGITSAVADVNDVAAIKQLCVDAHVAVLCVAAGRGGDYRRAYLDGARSLIEAISDTSVQHVIYTSSTRVYAQDDASVVDESSPTMPDDENGKILVDAERAILAFASTDDARAATVLRLGGIHGPNRDLTERIRSASGTQRHDGETILNLVHVHDVANAMTLLIDKPYDGVLNLVGDQPESRRTIYDRILTREHLPPIEWLVDPSHPASPAHPPNLGKRVSNQRLKDVLGLTLERQA